MTAEDLRDTREQSPFRPFILRVSDGRSFRIHHRDYLSISPDGRNVIVYKDDGGYHLLDPVLISGVDVEPVTAAPSPAAG